MYNILSSSFQIKPSSSLVWIAYTKPLSPALARINPIHVSSTTEEKKGRAIAPIPKITNNTPDQTPPLIWFAGVGFIPGTLLIVIFYSVFFTP
jgi:hypothetical protein